MALGRAYASERRRPMSGPHRLFLAYGRMLAAQNSTSLASGSLCAPGLTKAIGNSAGIGPIGSGVKGFICCAFRPPVHRREAPVEFRGELYTLVHVDHTLAAVS